ncbi:MAG: glycoside hydrolase family 13 protein [Treponemataceae bacterium]|nr:glycoside hydrolase family 13 protein [Treponemataceae bacterium]
MNTAAIQHRSALTDCYALDESRIRLNVRTGKDVSAVNVVWEDPYIDKLLKLDEWQGTAAAMRLQCELKHHKLWSVTLAPKFKRLQYYFEVFSGGEKLYFYEDDFYTEEELSGGRRKAAVCFKMPWLNPSDVAVVPKWAEGTVWYQIFPERFCSGGSHTKRFRNREWADGRAPSYNDFFGGDLRGVIRRLDYIQSLGVSGIYLTPVFESASTHKYNTADYMKIDPDFGTEEDMRELVEQAHARGIRVMIDAVFNHCGWDFAPWQDVVRNGEKSKYFGWFFVNSLPVDTGSFKTDDARFFSFSFYAGMPKLNTNNPEVADYFLEICRRWVSVWRIDGIRFDVGNEVAHSFIRHLRRGLKPLNPDLFLLGEIWHDSVQWLQGDEYDSVMNYPFIQAVDRFFSTESLPAQELHFALNRVLSMYSEQVSKVLFNFLDTHDTDRAASCCADRAQFLQKLVLLLSMPGSACLYYGTEIAMEGAGGDMNRKCMPWDEIDGGLHDKMISAVRTLVRLRAECPQMRSADILWLGTDGGDGADRIIRYEKRVPTGMDAAGGGGADVLEVCMNAGSADFLPELPADGARQVLFSAGFDGTALRPGGIVLFRK